MLPEKFDENEIFTLAALAGLMLALYLLPKAVSWKAGLANGLFFTAMACFADEVLSAMHPLNLYNTFDSPDLELLTSLFIYLFLPCTAICLLRCSVFFGRDSALYATCFLFARLDRFYVFDGDHCC